MAAGAVLILDYRATGGVMIGATIIGSRALQPIEQAVGMWKTLTAVRFAHQRLVELLSKAPRREAGMALPAPAGQLHVAGLHYVSPGSPKPILANIDFSLTAGQALGIVGPSASGKSTLARLLTGAWRATAGVVRLDGADIYSWPRQDLSRYIGYLPQDVELFAGTVRDNIARMGQGDPAEIVRAAELAHAHQMILSLPNGYDTNIGGGGYRLSAGQSQRVALARALFGEPRLVVLDEPNSNLDAAGEEAFIRTVAALKQRRVTVIVIAHRTNVLADMDKILVLQANGAMAAFGNRPEVMAHYFRPPQPRAQGPNVVPLPANAQASAPEAAGSAYP
jgi:PrtD family type I secretion system ABC transporter